MGEKEFVKGVINLTIDTNSLDEIFKTSSMGSTATTIRILQDHINTDESLKENVSIFKNFLAENPDLKRSWEELVGVSDILYVTIKSDYYIIYLDKSTKKVKLSIFWISDKNLEEIINQGSDILKKFFKEIKLKQSIRSVKKIKEMITNDSNIKFHPFFKESFKRDTNVDISNFKTKINTGKFLEKNQLLTFIFIILGNIITYLLVPALNIGAIVTSSVSLVVYLLVNYLLEGKLQVEVSISSLTFNEDTDDIYRAVVDSKTKELTDMDLSAEEEN